MRDYIQSLLSVIGTLFTLYSALQTRKQTQLMTVQHPTIKLQNQWWRNKQIAAMSLLVFLCWTSVFARSSTWNYRVRKSAPIQGKHFANERVLLDGKDFRECTFTNVTLAYNGTAPVQMDGIQIFGSMNLSSENPAVMDTAVLMKGLGMLKPGIPIGNFRDGKLWGIQDPTLLHIDPGQAQKSPAQ